MESSQRLTRPGYIDLAKRIESGEFDEEADDLDKQMMRNDLGETEGGDIIKDLLGL